MADEAKAAEAITRSGLAATYDSSLSASDTYVIPNDGRVFLHFKKTGAGNCTVTVATPNTVDGLAIADLTDTVPATTGDLFLGPFPPKTYGDALRVTLSEVTGLSMAVLRI